LLFYCEDEEIMNENRMGKTEGERRTKLESVKRYLENKEKHQR
jgi:hypothetical protein